ncbi:MAG: hypothetical protein H7Z40_10420 [Phycisphaerae bacterium]|nr:hypothetical protein [Gemmatimonadaceae bacterium]
MHVVERSAKVTVELGGVVTIDDERVTTVLPDAGALPPIVTGATTRRRRRADGRIAQRASMTVDAEWQAIQSALAAQDLTVVDAIPLRTDTIVPPPTSASRRSRRRSTNQESSTAALVSVVGVNVVVEDDEEVVILLEQDGVYSWSLGEVAPAPTAVVTAPRKGAKRAAAKRASKSAAPGKRVARFQLEVAPSRMVQRTADGRRRKILGKIAGKAVAYVLRFAAKPALSRASKWMERDIKEGLIHINGTDATAWPNLGPDGKIAIPATGHARVLLFVHGTFSSTLGSFGALGASDSGAEFLRAAIKHYDLVIGWNHRTLSVAPDKNASDLCAWFQSQAWPKPPIVDAIAYSRGGLVFRSLVEEQLPGAKKKVEIRRAVFVGSTNGGTELAQPANWHSLADTYLNLAAAGARAIGIVPGLNVAGAILSEAIGGVGSLVKVLATSAVDDDAIPGLAAMNPTGPFITRINKRQTGQPSPTDVRYYAITSNFDPDEAADEGRTSELPAGFLLKLADKAVDALQGRPNDLVVNVDAMTRIDPGVGSFVRERLDYGTNGTVHHCRYFVQNETADSLSRWLMSAG